MASTMARSPARRFLAARAGFAGVFDVLPMILPYLTIKDACALKCTSKESAETARCHTAEHLTITKSQLHASGPAARVFETYGHGLLSLTLYRNTFADRDSFGAVLAMCPNLRKLTVQDADWTNWDDGAAAAAVGGLRQLQEIRLQNSESTAERNPFSQCVRVLPQLTQLRKVTLFTRLDSGSVTTLAAWLTDHVASRRLTKVKVSTGLLAASNGLEVLNALVGHPSVTKLTIVRPEGMGDPLRKTQCAVLSRIMATNRGLTALHLRRCGMWTDTLSSLVPATECPHLKRLKLDGNSLGYLSGSYFNEAMDALLARLPNLTALHLGNNQLDARQAEGLAASFVRHHVDKLENLTMGSNDIGDVGLAAILRVLPPTMRQLYLHGIDCTDAGVTALRDNMERWPTLWGLGLNGNPITDSGARTLARALRAREGLRDVGITLSEMTDAGVARLAVALRTCPHLRYVYLYTTGFKAATKVTDEAKRALRDQLPPYATAAFDHRLSRYLKKP